MNFRCGHPDEWEFFSANYGRAIDEATKAHDGCLKMLTAANPQGKEETVLYALAAACLKEFEEICLLAGNGYGTGATKLLRAFYERVITLSYLAVKPEKVQQFIDYTNVHWRKLLIEAEEIHANINLPEDQIKIINDGFEASKDQYMEDVCKACGKKRLQMSWTKAGVPQQASQVNELLRKLAFNVYLRPTFYLHTTFFGITQQAQCTADGKIQFFGSSLQREHAREAMDFAHLLLIQTMDVVNEVFKLGQADSVEEAGQSWKDVWNPRLSPDSATEVPPEPPMR